MHDKPIKKEEGCSDKNTTLFAAGGHVINNFNRVFNRHKNRRYKDLYIFGK